MFFVCGVFFMAFVKCIFLWLPFWYPLAKVFFIFFDEYIWFACEKTYFPTKINQKCTLNKVSVIFVFGLHSRKKTPWGNKRLPTPDTLSIVLFLLSVWDLCLILIGGEQRGVSAVLSVELQWHGLMLCHWQERNRRPKRCVTSAHVSRVILFVTLAVHSVTAELQLVMREHLSLWGFELH